MIPFLLACLALWALVPWCINRWRFRHIPGPFAPPLIGNLVGIARLDIIGFLEHCRQQHGKIFKIYIGPSMLVCVADPVAARRMLVRLGFRHTGINLTAGPQDWNFLVDGLIVANGSTWRTLRAAWQPAFSPAALASYLPATQSALDRLCDRLDVAAASGEVVDLSKKLTGLTLDLVGTAAYGVDLHTLQQQLASSNSRDNSTTSSSSSSSSSSLLSSMQAVFDGGGVANSSAYMAAVLLFPALTRLWQWLAYRYPDKTLRTLAQARQRIRQVSLHLLHSWRPAAAPTNGSSSSSTSSNKPLSLKGLDPAAAADAAASAVQETGAQAAGVFPQTLLAARDKETGQPLTDEQVVAQLNTFLLAAFETTAAAAAFALYFVATHPQVEQRLLQELTTHQQQQQQQQGQQQQLDLTQLLYTEAVVQEALRLMPPGSLATRSTEQQGLTLQVSPTREVWLPPGTPLFGCIHAFQRDPDYWPHALEFRPERWLPVGVAAAAARGAALQPSTPDAYMPFGAGGRLCIGKQFAQQALLAAVSRLVLRYHIQLEPGQLPLPVKQTFALVPAQGLRARLSRRPAGAAAAAAGGAGGVHG